MVRTKDRPAPPAAALYEQDFHAWAMDQAALLRARSAAVDWDNLAEEIDSVGRSQRREIRSRMTVLLQHLLKWAHQPDRRSGSWESSILEQRVFIAGILADSPSLKRFPAEALASVYPHAADLAAAETGLPRRVFADLSPWPIDLVLRPGFLPDSSPAADGPAAIDRPAP